MDAGHMDQRITIERRTEVADGVGGVTLTWASLANGVVWAAVKAKAGRESLTEGRMNAVFVVEFTIYNRSDIDELCRVQWRGDVYNIRNVRREGGRKLRVVLDAERGVAE